MWAPLIILSPLSFPSNLSISLYSLFLKNREVSLSLLPPCCSERRRPAGKARTPPSPCYGERWRPAAQHSVAVVFPRCPGSVAARAAAQCLGGGGGAPVPVQAVLGKIQLYKNISESADKFQLPRTTSSTLLEVTIINLICVL